MGKGRQVNSLSPVAETLQAFLVKRSFPQFIVIMITLLCGSLLTSSISRALPTVQDKGTFRGAEMGDRHGSRFQGEGDSPLRSMSFTGLDFFSDYFGGRHRGDLVAQVYLFDMRTFSLNGDESSSRFDYAPCVIAPNLILLPQGRLNLKFGHIWHSYGLRNQINTTQTLRQLISQENMGLMLDWGWQSSTVNLI